MGNSEPTHINSGFLGLLSRQVAYRTLKSFLRREHNQERLVSEFIRPFPGCRILDIGCGTADIVAYLPDTISGYTGLDINSAYLESASRRWSTKSNCTFKHFDIRKCPEVRSPNYDIVLAIGVLHHLSDPDVVMLSKYAYGNLTSGGRLITYDGAYTPNQSPVAKWLLSHDRGKAVRTPEGYRALVQQQFENVSGVIFTDTIRLPYTIYLMTCTKSETEK